METKAKKVSLKTKFGWSSLTMSAAVSYTILAFLTLYATDVLGLNPGIVGALIMVSKLFDGVSDIIVGIIIDKTNSRFGKARPYALAIIGYWATTALLFSIPASMPQTASYAWLFVMYTLTYSVFATLFSCAEAPHMANAVEETEQSLSLLSFASVASAFMGLVAGIAIPQFIAKAGNDPIAWRNLIWVLAVPLALLGTLRFFLVKEIRNVDVEKKEEKVTIKDMVGALRQNKYIGILAILVFIAYFATALSSGAANYYNKYIIGDLGAASLLSLGLLPLIIVMAFVPALARKFTLKKTIIVLMVLGIIGSLIRFVAPSNLIVCFVSTCLYGVSFQAFYGFAATMVIECMDYGEWKTNTRVEGVMGSAQSMMNKIGTALGAGASGLLLMMAGYDGSLEVQSAGAINMMMASVTVIPAILGVIFLIIFHFYDLEKKLPAIQAELKERHGE